MRASDIKISDILILPKSPQGYLKVVEVLKPKQKENYNTYTVVKCILSTSLNFEFGYIKYFKPSDLEKFKSN